MNLEQNLSQRISEVLYYNWDPIGVNDFGPESRDEYDSYVPKLVKAIIDGATVADIEKILYRIETEAMEVRGIGDARKAVAELLVDWHDFLKR